MATKFYLCPICGNVVVKVADSGVDLVCCGREMKEISQGTMDGMREKHLPVVERLDGCTYRVKVGSEPHPMIDEHHIVFIYFETENGGQIKYLKPLEKPEVIFYGIKEKPVAVYAYCNIHGMWRKDLNYEKNDCSSDNCSSVDFLYGTEG